jgi:hypothetical protein
MIVDAEDVPYRPVDAAWAEELSHNITGLVNFISFFRISNRRRGWRHSLPGILDRFSSPHAHEFHNARRL